MWIDGECRSGLDQPGDYIPHFTPEALAEGAPNRLEALQGVDNTWYSGGSTVLEAIDNIVDYNVLLVLAKEHQITGSSRLVYRARRALTSLAYHSW